ncbi:MAG TPA: enolase C-terminal domain-like protein [Actinomycetes bacterium]|nr:enolase C-terminal domain-like protein [Actinomycetes bacterium]
MLTERLGCVESVAASAYTVPTDRPEADGTLTWDSTTLVLVQVHCDGQVGTGWTYGSPACVEVVIGLLSPLLVGRGPLDTGAAWTAMVQALRNVGRPGIGGMALSAVDCALWDLKARLLGVPLHRLLGAVHESVPLYGSGGFTTYDDDELVAALTGWTAQGLSRVKIKVGESWGGRPGRDLARAALSRDVVGAEVELFVDANGGYDVGQAVRMAGAFDELDVRWFEEPVSSDDLAGLATVQARAGADVTAGEYGFDLAYLARMARSGAVDCLQVDVTRCGGITELLRVAAAAAGCGLDVSGHCAPHQHVAALAAVPNLRHLEWFHDHVRIETLLFDGALAPERGALVPNDDRPGHGLAWRPEAAEEFRVSP